MHVCYHLLLPVRLPFIICTAIHMPVLLFICFSRLNYQGATSQSLRVSLMRSLRNLLPRTCKCRLLQAVVAVAAPNHRIHPRSPRPTSRPPGWPTR
ncbi:hypothetical protein HD806DRAFT_514897 [Xylariaceae sp. AK1471]|nr:hypothetical protein HD806DRAFT_514897 [Xylariaceae sp. AK1471]